MPRSSLNDFSRVERGLNYMVVWQNVILDRQRQMLPVLYALRATETGVRLFRSDVLVRYMADHDAKSGQWMLERARAVGMLIEYTAASLPYFQPSKRGSESASYTKILTLFAKAVLNGTAIMEKGRRYDGVGLYWPPRKETAAKRLLSALTSVLRWISVKASEFFDAAMGNAQEPFHAVRIAYQHIIQRNKSLLAHLKSERKPDVSHPFSGLFGSASPRVRTYRFPTKYVWPLLFKGFRNSHNKLLDETAQVIALLLFAGGSRLSELFNTWVNDLQWANGEPILFLHHPRNGDVRTGGETISRKAYLERKNLKPRNRLRKRGQAGHKGLRGDDEGAELVWLPLAGLSEELSRRLRHYVTATRPRIMRLRKAQGLQDHPYLFVGSGSVFGTNTNAVGAPYTIEAFRAAWKAAIGRISRLYDDPDLVVAKKRGTTPHGSRHFYGTFLKTIGCDGDIISKCMHHKSPFSHLRYTELTANEINSILTAAANDNLRTSDYRALKGDVSEALRRQVNGRAYQ